MGSVIHGTDNPLGDGGNGIEELRDRQFAERMAGFQVDGKQPSLRFEHDHEMVADQFRSPAALRGYRPGVAAIRHAKSMIRGAGLQDQDVVKRLGGAEYRGIEWIRGKAWPRSMPSQVTRCCVIQIELPATRNRNKEGLDR